MQINNYSVHQIKKYVNNYKISSTSKKFRLNLFEQKNQVCTYIDEKDEIEWTDILIEPLFSKEVS